MAKGSVRWLGHAMSEFTTSDGKVILFDPWTKEDGNPGDEVGLARIQKADLVLASHDHFDHICSAGEICKKTGALLGGPAQTMKRMVAEGFPDGQIVNFGSGYMPGGGAELDWVTVYATHAYHASETGVALGHIVRAADGTTVYHAGDTGLFSEMEIYAKLYPIDVAFIPIGGVFTMDAKQASHALTMLKPKMAIPMHYGSFPIIAQSADQFVDLAAKEAPGVKVVPLDPGVSFDLSGV
jgi:L-ascorbate metabolism protein UlaG (beta-lactamase superfamily)